MTVEIVNEELIVYLNEGTPDGVTLDGVQVVTNKTIDLGDNTVTGTKAQFNTALTDGDFAFVGDVQPIDANLTAIAALAGTTGLLRKTAANTWSLDTTAFSTLAVGSTVGAALGTASAGVASTAARSDHVHPFPTAANVGAEPAITAGTTAQYWRGDKSWRDLFTDVRAATLTGLSTATNAVITAADTALSALGKLQAQVSAKVDATNGVASGLTLNDGYTEEVFTVTGTTPALSPTNGTYQAWTLTANSTPTAGTWANGQSLTLHIDDGTAATVTWTSLAVTWKTNGGVAPTLLTTGITVIQFWKSDGVIYGARVGDA